MKKYIVPITLGTLLFSAASLTAQVRAGAVFSGDGLSSFFFSVGSYYHVPEPEVTAVYERAISPEEVPVVFYVAQRARVAPVVVVNLRRRGMSWANIAFHFRLDPDIYDFRAGPPYGKAHGYWKKHPPRDAEVIDAINVHFLAGYHKVSPDVVWAQRSRGRSYVAVAGDFEEQSHRGRGHGTDDDESRGNGRGHGHGHGKGHDR